MAVDVTPFGYEPYQVGAYWYLRPHLVYVKEAERIFAGETVAENVGQS